MYSNIKWQISTVQNCNSFGTNLIEHWFIIKRYDSGMARWKRCIGQGMEKGHRASLPSPRPLLLNLHWFTNPEALWTLSFNIFMEVSLYRRDWLSHWQLSHLNWNISPSSLPRSWKWGKTQSSNSLITWLTLLVTSPHTEVQSKVTLLT